MNRLRALVVFAGVAIAASCGNSVTGPDAVAGTPFALKAGATATLPNGSRLTFERVSADSRCPMDALCVWAGDATVAVTVKAPAGTAEARELHTEPGRSQMPFSDYTITLAALAPYPRSSQTIQPADYSATFVVSVR
jgi:hypothetical protein